MKMKDFLAMQCLETAAVYDNEPMSYREPIPINSCMDVPCITCNTCIGETGATSHTFWLSVLHHLYLGITVDSSNFNVQMKCIATGGGSEQWTFTPRNRGCLTSSLLF